MSCFSVDFILCSLNSLLTLDETDSSKSECVEKIKVDFNQANHYLTSRMGSFNYQSLQGAVQDAGWISSICTKASSIFNHVFGGDEGDDIDYHALETEMLYKILHARSEFVTEIQREMMLDMLITSAVSEDPKGYIDATVLVFSYGLKNPGWQQKNKEKLFAIYKTIEEYVEITDLPNGIFQKISSLAEKVIPKDTTYISITVDDTVFKANRMKMLLASEFVKKMILGPFSEKGSYSITLHGMDQASFKLFAKYVDTRDIHVFDDLDLISLIKLNACSSRLIADLKTRQSIISKINEKVSDMTIGYTEDHLIELTFHGDVSKSTLSFLTDAVVEQETGLLDLRSIEVTNKVLRTLLQQYSNTRILYLSYDSNISRSDWLTLSTIARVTELHLDFQGTVAASKQSFLALEEVATKHRKMNAPFNVHVENAGKLEVDSLRKIVSSIPTSIVSLDLSGSGINDDALSEVLEDLCNLEKLNLDYCKKLHGSEFLKVIGDSCPSVKELSLYQSARLKESFLIDLFDDTQYLTTLNVGWHHYLTDAFVNKLSEKCKNLEVVDFTNLKNLSDSSLKSLAKKCTELAKVKLDFCKSLTNQSLLELNEYATNLHHLSIRQMFQRRTPMSIEIVGLLMESKSDPFELVINKSCSDLTNVVALASKYPMVTVTAK